MLRKMTTRWDANEHAKFQQAADAKRDEFCQSIRKTGLWDYLSPCEQAHIQSTLVTMTERQQVDASWRLESVLTLMWVLGISHSVLPYDVMANPDLLKQFPLPDTKTFIRSVQLRKHEEISRTRQLIERGDALPSDEKTKQPGFRSYDDIVRTTAWMAAKDGTILPCINEDFPAKGKAYRDLTDKEWSEVRSITVERHYTLNWLCGFAPDNRWDEVPTDT
jgi:hypothetical protein